MTNECAVGSSAWGAGVWRGSGEVGVLLVVVLGEQGGGEVGVLLVVVLGEQGSGEVGVLLVVVLGEQGGGEGMGR